MNSIARQFLIVLESNNLWYNFDTGKTITDQTLRQLIETGDLDPNQVSDNPEEFPVYGDVTKAIDHWLPLITFEDPFAKMPMDILEVLFAKLNVRDILNLGQVNKRFNNL
ncbi:MAG: F-box protein, partial [Candidatus Roizmanbacteria bacterium]